MKLYQNQKYLEDINWVAELPLPWEKLQNNSFLISGATGLIGSFLVDVLLHKNLQCGLNCTVYALGRNEQKAKQRFEKFRDDEHLVFIPYDITRPLKRDDIGTVNYVLHLASNTHPMQYATDPIGTITTNIIGVQNMIFTMSCINLLHKHSLSAVQNKPVTDLVLHFLIKYHSAHRRGWMWSFRA